MRSPANGTQKLTKRTAVAAGLILGVIPLTIWIGFFLLDNRKYYFISLLILLYTMIPFAMVFERRRPQARELIIIAVLSALGVAGRAAFFMLPQFKPVVALVIIAGVSLGGEAGFLVGAMTAFVSNFFFGQGPWTPFQMFSFGIIGFFAGILFQKGLLPGRRLPLCLYGGFAALILFGGIMDPCSVLLFQGYLTRETLLAAYLSGFWFNLIHAAATVLFLLLLSGPMLGTLDRIKIKFGLMEP